MDIVDEFLYAWAKDFQLEIKDLEGIKRWLCERYHYGTNNNERFLTIAYGWMWGRTDDGAEANAGRIILKRRMDEIYSVVAKENDWKD